MSQRPAPTDDGNDWSARHARCRQPTERPSVVVEDIDDDWARRHAETRRSRSS